MTSKLNVLLVAKGQDKGAGRQLRKLTKLADDFTVAANKASAAGQGLGGIQIGGAGGGGRSRAGGRARPPRAPRAAGAPRAASAAKQRAKLERDVNRAIAGQVKEAKAQKREMAKAERLIQKRQRAQKKLSRQTENMSDAQLEGVEIQREINRRRKRTARRAAETRLGKDRSLKSPDAAGPMSKGARGVQFGANLAIAGQEFEQFGQQVEGGLRSTFDSFKRFEQGVTEITTLTDDIPAEEIAKITKQAALDFATLPTEQTAAFYSIVSAGATTAAEAQEQLTAANQLAIGGLAQTEDAVLAISKSVANFGDQGETATTAADSLFAAVRLGQTTVSELASAFPAVAQTAAATGLTLDETNASIAVLSKTLGSSAEASTALKGALGNILKPSKEAQEVAKELGVDFTAAAVAEAKFTKENGETVKGFEAFLFQLKEVGATEAQLAKLFGSKRGFGAARGLIQSLDDDTKGFSATLDQTEDSAGAAGAAAAKNMDTAAKRAEKLEAKMELLKIQAGEALVPALTEVAEQLGPIIEDTTEWIRANPQLATTIGKVAIGAAVLGRGIGVLTSGISMASSVMGIARVAGNKFDGVLGNITKNSPRAGKALGKLGNVNFAGPFLIAAAALAGFEAALSAATEAADQEQQRLDDLNKVSIEFKTKGGAEKSEAALLAERRERLFANVRGAEGQLAAGSGEQFRRQLGQGNITSAAETFGISSIDFLSGAQGEKERQRTAAVNELAAFDVQFGEQLGLTPEQFTPAASTGLDFDVMVEELRKLNETSAATAKNTSGQAPWWQGASMEAGLQP